MKRKQIITILCLALSLTLLCSTSFAASTGIFDVNGVYSDIAESYANAGGWMRSAKESCVMDDGSMWMTVYSNLAEPTDDDTVFNRYEFYHWTPGSEAPELISDDVLCGNAGTMELLKQFSENYGAPKTDFSHPIENMFCYKNRLACLSVANGTVFFVDVKDGALTYEPVCTLSDVNDFFISNEPSSELIYPANIVTVDDSLIILLRGWNDVGDEDDRVLVINLRNGNVKRVSAIKGAQCITPYKDGKVLLAVRENFWNDEKNRPNPAEILVFNPADHSTEKIMDLDTANSNGINANAIGYSPTLDAVIYEESNRIMAADGKTVKQVAYSPNTSVSALEEKAGKLYLHNYGPVVITDLDPNFSPDKKLTIRNGYMSTGPRAFLRENPDVPLYYPNYADSSTVEAISNDMITGSNAVDIITVNSDQGVFDNLVKKGYCMDLSSSKIITDYVNELYPQFRDYVSRDGKIFAIPTNAYSYDAWQIDKGLLERMNLTVDDIPTNYVDLCAFMTKWNDSDWLNEYPDVQPVSYFSNHRDEMMSRMINAYQRYCVQQNTDVDFSSPLFRQLMDAVDKMHVNELDAHANHANEDEVGYRLGLMEDGRGVIGSFYRDEYYIPVRMNLTPDVELGEAAHLELVFVNPKSANAQYAIRYLECLIEQMEKYQKATLLSTCNQPVENKFYAVNVAQQQQIIAKAEKQLAEAKTEDDKQTAQMYIDNAKENLESIEKYSHWNISPEAIEDYSNIIAPRMFVARPAFPSQAANDEISTLRRRYIDRQISMEQFIKEATNKAKMMQLEAQ